MWANTVWGFVGAGLSSLLSALVPDKDIRWWQMRAAVAFFVIAALIAVWPWLWKRLFPRPVVLREMEKAKWSDSDAAQWIARIRLKLGWLLWIKTLKNCRIYFI